MVDGVLEDPPEEEITPGMSPDLVADAELYQWAGLTLGEDAFFLHRSLQMLSAKEEVKVSYFGKVRRRLSEEKGGKGGRVRW